MALNPQQMAQLQAILAQQQQQQAKADVEFRAGICQVKGRSVTADTRRGKLELFKEESGEIRLQWSIRPSNQTEISLVLLPQQAVFHKIPECKDGRIFALQFIDAPTRHLFWLQEPIEGEEKDNNLLKKLNETIQAGVYHPRSTASAAPSASSIASSAAGTGAADMGLDPALLAELGMGDDAAEQAELLEMIRAAAEANQSNTPSTPAPKPSTNTAPAAPAHTSTAPATTASTASSASAQSALLSALQSIAQQFQANQAAAADDSEKQPTLNDVLDVDQVYSIVIEDENLLKELLALLPEGQRTKEDLKSQLRSPQLRSTLSRMTGLLNSAQYGQLLASLSLPTNTTNMGVLGFIEAIHKAVQKKGNNNNSTSSASNSSGSTEKK